MKQGCLILQEVCERPTDATVVTFVEEVITLAIKITPSFIAMLLRVTAVGAPECIQV
jgi:hypothetical protein|tara:strand:- start:78 stop:248 length:171 start_codon:yes stop_codon:yes gene_type:complete